MPLAGKLINKGTQPSVCKCGVVIFRAWVWSDKDTRHEPTYFDCEAPGNKRPTKWLGGFGQIHVHQITEKSA